jgi:uncharacterized protein (TIGR00251 family)
MLKVLVRPRSAHERIEGLRGDCLKISINAPPAEGRANEACLRFLAHQLGLKRTQLSLRGGQRSPIKLIAICDCPAPQIQERLSPFLQMNPGA